MRIVRKYLVATIFGLALSIIFPFSLRTTVDPCPQGHMVPDGVDSVGDTLYRFCRGEPYKANAWSHAVYNVVINVTLLNVLAFVIRNISMARKSRQHRDAVGTLTELKRSPVPEPRAGRGASGAGEKGIIDARSRM